MTAADGGTASLRDRYRLAAERFRGGSPAAAPSRADSSAPAAPEAALASPSSAASPSYAAWATSVAEADDVLGTLLALAPTKRQPELVFAVARRLGADPADAGALVALARRDPVALVTEVSAATMQTNDPRRLAAVLPLFAAIAGPIGLVDVGVSAGLCSVPDRVTLDYRLPDGSRRRMATAPRGPSVTLVADATGPFPPPVGRLTIVHRVGLDPSPLDLRIPEAFDRLVESVPPEATDRVALMREAARVTRAVPPELIRGSVPDDLERALAALPDGCTPVVLTMGTLVYLPGADRQAFVDLVRARAVRWIAMERTGVLTDVAATLPSAGALADQGLDLAAPDTFATVSLDGKALALTDAHGTVVHWLRDDLAVADA